MIAQTHMKRWLGRLVTPVASTTSKITGVVPWIVANTALRDRAINKILASPSVTASSQGASLGWFSPLTLNGLQLSSTNNRIRVDVKSIAAERSLLQLVSTAPDLGTITLESPHVQLVLPLDMKIERPASKLEPTFKAVVRNAGLAVRVAELEEPVIDVDGINMTLRVEPAEEGRLLTVDPLVVFDRRKLSPKLGDKLLQLFAPTLYDAPQVGGEVSLSLDKLRVPLGIPQEQAVKRLEIEGKLGLHQIATVVKNPIDQAVVKILADMYGKPAPEVVRVVVDGEVPFQVRDGRLFHEGLRLGFPEIDPGLVISSHGSVGLDQTLDLQLDLPRLDPELRKTKGPAKCHVAGTIAHPKINVEDGSLVLRHPNRKDPIIAVDGVRLSMRVEDTASGRVLAVEPVEVFKREKVSLAVKSGLLKLLSPAVGDERHVNGEISLFFDKLRLPLGTDSKKAFKQLQTEGTITLHRVSSEVLSPAWQAWIRAVAKLNGKEPSDVIHLVADSEVRFRIDDGRLYHEGLRIGFPDIDPGLTVTSRGSIGLDGSLDLILEVPRIFKDQLDPEMAMQSVPFRVTGTIDKPVIVGLGAETAAAARGEVPFVNGAGSAPGIAPPVSPNGHQAVELTFDADRNQLFTAWNAIANLADLLGKVKVTIRAESQNGFDEGKLQNDVMEPLREMHLIR